MEQNPPPYNQDEEQLRLLVIFHKVMTGFYGLFGFCGFPHFFIGLTGATNPQSFASQGKGTPTPDSFFWLFAFVGLGFILGAWIFAILNWIASKRIEQRQGTTFIYIVAGLNCMWMPIGTALGVFTFIVITRPTVRTLFPR